MTPLWQNPSYDADLEPPQLKRPRCGACRTEEAIVRCPLCNKHLCVACEEAAHLGPHQGDHRSRLVSSSSCDECKYYSREMYCQDCEQSLCMGCCMRVHMMTSARVGHAWVCTSESPSSLYQQMVWHPVFKEQVKMCRRELQRRLENPSPVIFKHDPVSTSADDDGIMHSPDTDDDLPPDEVRDVRIPKPLSNAVDSPSVKLEQLDLNADQSTDSVSREETDGLHVPNVPSQRELFVPPSGPLAPTIKLERTARTEPSAVSLASSPDASGSLDVRVKMERPNIPPPAAPALSENPPSLSVPLVPGTMTDTKAEAAQRPRLVEIVDLTEDDGETENEFSSRRPPNTLPFVKSEDTILAQTSILAEWYDGHVGNPLWQMMIDEYDKKNQAIVHAEEELREAERQIKEAYVAGRHDELKANQNTFNQLKGALRQDCQARNALVARLVVFATADHEQFQKVLVASTPDVPHAQDACHRHCVAIQKDIQGRVVQLVTLKQNMEEAINLKSTHAFAEITRLGSQIGELEHEIRQLELQRLEQFVNLCRFSKEVRDAAKCARTAPP